ncbi:MAG TPA: hypothetical protein VEJ46_02450 [Candidatus Acidoferrum sp.]|nr:hypothetical protein [Candidatus Acidoferrum sp.]
MSNEQATPNPAGESAASRRGAPREVHEFIDHIANCFDVPAEVREHFTNSRIEFLKGIRAAIDHRIERLSATAQHGSKIAVE